ncbi:MAG: O-antigen ligase family protein, partial [Chloroflexi bacterium]|nr:O-antigen ligase family protein [Chloroflexota bacterium]
LWATRRVATGHFVPPTPLDGSLLGLLAMTLVSLFVTYDLSLTLPRAVLLVFGVAVFYAAAAFSGASWRRLVWGVVALLGAGLAIAVLGLISTRLPVKISFLQLFIREGLPGIIWTFPGDPDGFSPNRIAAALLWITPLAWTLAATLLLAGRRAFSRGTWLALASSFVALFLSSVLLITQSRAGLVGFAVGLLFLALVAFRNHRWLLLGGLALAATAAVATLAFNDLFGLRALWLQVAYTSIGSPAPAEALTFRTEIWSRAIQATRDFAFTGLGLNTFPKAVLVLYPYFLLHNPGDATHAHNQLLQMGVDMGVPGMVVYLALLLGAAAMLLRVWRKNAAGWGRALAAGFAGCLLAFQGYGLFDAVGLGEKPAVILWFLLGLVAGLHRLAMQSSETGHPSGRQADVPAND